MNATFQVTIDCKDPPRMCEFWTAALGYEIEPPPEGFATWDDYWRKVGVSESDLGIGPDCIVDPAGRGPRIWFHIVTEPKVVKNRIHLDLRVGGSREVQLDVRKQRVETEADRLVRLGATRLGTGSEEGVDHYAVARQDPEGNEFDIL